MGVSRCVACPECGSDLAESPTSHSDPIPHEWVTRYDEVTGKPYEICRMCTTKREAVEASL